MTSILLKTLATLISLWVLTHLAANPSTLFAEWGERVCKSYENFLITIMVIFLFPAAIIGIILIWIK